MDIALRHNPDLKSLDILVDAGAGDLVAEDQLTTAVVLSLMCDRTAQPHEVDAGGDRRGWWADAYAVAGAVDAPADQCGSRLWLLQREKQVPETQRRVRAYVLEALQWLVDDGLALALEATVFVPRAGWYVADVRASLSDGDRRWRFEFDQAAQTVRLAGELQ